MPTFESFLLPDAGEGLTEAEIVQWLVAVGDDVAVNQTIVEIETAKSLVELPSPWAGRVAALLVPEGTTVEVGTPIITIDTDPDGPPAADDAGFTRSEPAGSSAPDDAARPVAGTSDAASAGSGGAGDPAGATTAGAADVSGGGAVSDGGDGSGPAVLVGYGVAADAPSRRRGTRAPAEFEGSARVRRSEPSNSAQPVELGGGRGVASGTGGGTEDGAGTRAAASGVTGTGAGAGTQAVSGRAVLAKPPVRKLARDLGVDLATVSPTGPGGIVTREDVLARAKENEPQTLAAYPDEPWLASGTVSPDGRFTRVPVKSVRKRTAEAMVASAFTAPHVSVFHTVDVTRTMALVARLREDREFADVKVTPLLVAMKALLIAVRRHPEINASWDDAAQEIVYKHYVNLGIAAQTPRGLVVPNIKDAHRLGLHDLAVALGELTADARAGRTTPTAMSDGTITVTNVGVFGIDTGTPILNPGEAAILAFGAIREQPWVHKGKVKARHVTQLALSFDHRLVDGGLGSRVLADVARVLEEPGQALVWG